MNKNYFNYLLKSKKSLIVIICIIYALVYATTYVSSYENQAYSYVLPLLVSGLVIGVLAYAIAPIMFNYIHNKKAVDSYFALPVSRKQMLITTEVFSFLVVIVPFIILSLISLLIAFVNNSPLNITAFLLFDVISVVGVISIILFNTAVFCEANSLFDGITLILAYALLPLFALIAIECFQSSFIYGFDPLNSTRIVSYLSLPISVGAYAIDMSQQFNEVALSLGNILIDYLICVAWHFAVSFMFLSKNYVERKTERAETISNNFFSYPFVICAYVFALVFISVISSYFEPVEETIIYYALIFIAFVISNSIYRRKFIVRIKDIIYFIIIVSLSVGFSVFSFRTLGPGLSNSYDKNPENVIYSYNQYLYYGDAKDDDELATLINKQYNAVCYEASFSTIIDHSLMDDHKELIDLLENKRQEAIDNHYESFDNAYQYGPRLYIVNNFNEEDEYINHNFNIYYKDVGKQYNYFLKDYMTIEELKLLNKYDDVLIRIDFENNSIEVTLNELLNKVN